MYYLGIDPGVNHTGVAILNRMGLVVDAFLISRIGRQKISDNLKNQASFLFDNLDPHIDVIKTACIEKPIIYPDQPFRQNDILDLGIMAGAFASVLFDVPKVLLPTPKDWKGTTPKAMHNKRILKKVKNLDTFLCGYPKTKHEHIIDAAGLALYALQKER